MAPAPSPALPPRRFRRRLVAWLLVAGLVPMAIGAAVNMAVLSQALSISPPLDPLLDRAAVALEHAGGAPAVVEDVRQAQLNLAQAELARQALVARVPYYLAGALLISALGLAAAAWVLGRRLVRPVEALTAGMARVGRGDLDEAIPARPETRGDELDFLIRGFNEMSRELGRQRRRLHVTEKLAAWQDAARTLGHDLKNPLTAMKMALGRLTRPGRSEEALREAAALLHEEIDLLIRMTESFAAFAQLPQPAVRALDLASLLDDVRTLYGQQVDSLGVELKAEIRPTVQADTDQLRRAFGNLVKNALEASRPEDGPVVITLAIGGAEGHVRVVVADRGVGIPAPLEGAALARPRGSSKVGGSGLGLPIAQKIIHDHGGSLRLQPRSPRGTEAIVELPVQESAGT